ncbi:uncharacterized protein Z518_08734 [Rhinocladiella mackenziei CBS 650.93]|uniref:Uncharacterized protein n=1 Tax=Rhinocladiella mackenziei CBS 650.93 TaxID=1442369 RepID=A0A0D2FLD3_9EURO|nr:uncharacterized protein Z518_08734 [Rhinocladiella mackenziei CBS 650.93]KIX02792.1 hypothetical protein Z518_08734 [Rhinocladiella mackenziei CBS 650.93]
MPQPELTPDQYQNLLRKYRIGFEGPTAPRKWPRNYAETFNAIHQISRIWMEDYVTDPEHDILPIREKRERVAQLMNSAALCLRRSNTNEKEWRDETEAKVFARFFSEVVCRSCRNYFWLSDFEAWPNDEEAVRRLRRQRDQRRLCHCSLLDRAHEDDGRVPLFSSRSDVRIFHEDMEDLEREGLKKQKPDRVIGLGPSRSLDYYTRFRGNTHSPFNGGDVFYPFIVIEAKPEAGPGFKSIERQSAFSVRTCLRLQQKLQTDTRIPHQCLVWFFAFQGEEWRLYAALPAEHRTRVIDLWHGTILSENGALQLCLIVDYLCTWARNVYRDSILTCLAGGRANLRRLTTPISTHFPSQESEADVSSRWEIESLPVRLSQGPPDHRNGVNRGGAVGPPPDPMDTDEEDDHPAATTGQEDTFHWLRWTSLGEDSPPWAPRATIRHSNLVQITFQGLNLPPDRQKLRRCLEMCFSNLQAEEAARRLIATLLNEDISVTTSSNIMLRKDHRQGEAHFAVKAFIYFRTFLRPADWQIERRLLYITCSRKAMEVLASIAETTDLTLEYPDTWRSHDCECLFRVTKSLNLFGGKESAGLALSERQMCLKLANGDSHVQLVQYKPGGTGGRLTPSDLEMVSQTIAKSENLEICMTEHRTPYRVLSSRIDAEISADVLDLPDLGNCRGVLIKKPGGWPSATPEFCFLTTDDQVNFEDVASVGNIIQETRDRAVMFGIRSEKIAAADDLFLDRWIQILQGKLPDSAPLP